MLEDDKTFWIFERPMTPDILRMVSSMVFSVIVEFMSRQQDKRFVTMPLYKLEQHIHDRFRYYDITPPPNALSMWLDSPQAMEHKIFPEGNILHVRFRGEKSWESQFYKRPSEDGPLPDWIVEKYSHWLSESRPSAE